MRTCHSASALGQAFTLGLFKNDQPLYEQGLTAFVETRAQATWSPAITSGNTLSYSIDKTPAVTAVFTDAAFQAFDPAATVSNVTDINTWALVCNALMPGVITTVQDNVLKFQSSRGASSQASIEITGGTARFTDIFYPTQSLVSVVVQTSDYTLNIWTGQIGFTSALDKGDKITAWFTVQARGKLADQLFTCRPLVQACNIWFITDGGSVPLPNGFAANTNITFNKTGTLLTVSSYNPGLPNVGVGFETVLPGDWLIIWGNPTDSPLLQSAPGNAGFWRVRSVSLTPTLNSVTVDDGPTVRTNGGPIIPAPSRIVLVRSSAPVQQLIFTVPGTGLPLVQFLDLILAETEGVAADIEGSKVRISTSTLDLDGQIFIAAVDQGGSSLGLNVGTALKNVPSYYGYSAATDAEAGVPSFTHSTLGAAITDRIFTVPDYEALGGSQGDFLEVLNQYQVSPPSLIYDSNIHQRSFDTQWNPANSHLTMIPPLYMDSPESIMAQGDRFFLRSSYKFDSNDSSNVIVDNNSQTNSFLLPISRQLIVSSASTPTAPALLRNRRSVNLSAG